MFGMCSTNMLLHGAVPLFLHNISTAQRTGVKQLTPKHLFRQLDPSLFLSGQTTSAVVWSPRLRLALEGVGGIRSSSICDKTTDPGMDLKATSSDGVEAWVVQEDWSVDPRSSNEVEVGGEKSCQGEGNGGASVASENRGSVRNKCLLGSKTVCWDCASVEMREKAGGEVEAVKPEKSWRGKLRALAGLCR
jgi:hypothetical protein